MDICIIGYGYLGCRIAHEFTASGYGAVAIKRRPQKPDHEKLRIITTDLCTQPLPVLSSKLAAIIYCASPDGPSEEAYTQTYDRNLRKVLAWYHESYTGVPFILTSSTGIYNQCAGEVVKENAPVSLDSAIRKILGHAESYVKEWAPHHYVLRLAGLYGPERLRMFQVLANVDEANPANQDYLDSPLNLIHAADAARLAKHLLETGAPWGIYNGVDNQPTARREIREWILTNHPDFFQSAYPPLQPRPLRAIRYCCNEKVQASGFRFSYPDFRVGLNALLNKPSNREL